LQGAGEGRAAIAVEIAQVEAVRVGRLPVVVLHPDGRLRRNGEAACAVTEQERDVVAVVADERQVQGMVAVHVAEGQLTRRQGHGEGAARRCAQPAVGLTEQHDELAAGPARGQVRHAVLVGRPCQLTPAPATRSGAPGAALQARGVEDGCCIGALPVCPGSRAFRHGLWAVGAARLACGVGAAVGAEVAALAVTFPSTGG
jgi:hypothetical protein